MKVLVCGGRNYTDYEQLYTVLDKLPNFTELVEGGARGADHLAGQYADSRGVDHITMWANWKAYGKSAGFKRNSKMLGSKPDLVVAFPGGAGTANMIKLAKEAGIEVMKIEQDTD